MPFLLAEILNFQGSTHHIGVGSFSYLNIKSKKSNHFPTYEADYVIAGIRYHDKKVVKEHDFINKKILWSENNESAFGPYEKIEQIAKSKKA